VWRFFQREGIKHGTIYGDSMLVIRQLSVKWKAREGAYLPFYHQAVKLRRELPGVIVSTPICKPFSTARRIVSFS